MTDPEDELFESVKRAARGRAKEKAKAARISRINQADNDVRSFNESHSQKDFWKEWSERIVTLGQVLKTEKWDRHLDSIQFDSTDDVRRDAFNYAVQIFQAAVSGDVDKVLTRLKYLSKAATSGDENEREEMEKFCAVVNEALRRDIMPMLRKKEYSTQNQTRSTLDVGNESAPTQNSVENSEVEFQYITLDMAAAIVNRAKSTLRKYPDLPEPDVNGGGKGKPNEWLWKNIRPWLEKKFDRPLPEIFPGDRFSK